MDQSFVSGLHALLVQSTASDTVKLRAATAQLNREYYGQPACIPALATIIASTPEDAVRQLAAVELRKRVQENSGEMWLQLPQNEREEIKSKLPELVLADNSKLVRHSTARVIAAIASIELPVGTWNQLLPFLLQTVQSSTTSHREVGSFILFTIVETIAETSTQHLQEFLQVFQTLLADPESLDVRITTVRSLGSLAQYLDIDDKSEVRAFQNLLPGIIQVLGQCVEAGNEEGSRQLFDVLETLLIIEAPVLGRHIPDLAQFLIQCGANRNFDADIRVLALNALNWTIQYKKSKVQGLNLGPAILEGLMPIATEEEPTDPDDDAPSRSALRVVDSLATNLPPTQIFPALRALIHQYFTSAEPSHRRAALLALGVSVEGCSEYMTPQMAHVWPMVEAGLNDSDAAVRKAACTAVSCLCEWLEEECAERHTVLIPVIMNLVNDPATQRSACTSLDALLEILGDKIDQYLHLIMERLAGLLETGPLPVKGSVTGAIGSAAHASKEKFLPYFEPTMQRLTPFLVLTGEGEEQELRGTCMDTVGTFAEAVGPDAFRPYFADLMKQAYEGVTMGSPRLRECSFLFFGVMARVFGEEFAPYLPEVVPQLIQSCKQPEIGGEPADVASSAEAAANFATGSSRSNAIVVAAADESIEVNVEDLDADRMLEASSAIAVEKEIAADTMGTLFAATKNHYLPHLESSTHALVELLDHYYEGIRKSSTDSLLAFVRTMYDMSNPADWQPGMNAVAPLDPHVKDLITHIITPLLDMSETEDTKTVVSSLCVGLAETINKVGPAFFQGNLEHISQLAATVLEQKALCQQDPDQEEGEEAPEDQAEYDSVLISSAGDLVASLANALGADFSVGFKAFYPLISKYYSKGRSLSDRSSCIGTLAEIIAGMKEAVTPWTESMFELFYRALGDSDAEVMSNAAFASGMLVEHSQQDLSAQFQPLLAALHPLFVVPNDASQPRRAAKDNAAGAVGRMIVRNTSAVPLEQVLPVFLDALPLKNDYLENKPVFRAIFHLFQTTPQSLAPFTERLLVVFSTVLDPANGEQLTEDTRAPLLDLVRLLNTQAPAQVQAAGLAIYI